MCNHREMKRTDRWQSLRYVGTQITPADDLGPEVVLELRNCPKCSSTLAKQIDQT